MSRQDKATTDRNARTLRELVRQADNKNCADCKKNDARWASWNLGLFICIRCSGIHRSMGTHISKVKSIDLDIWQPEQMESVQKWGNRRANCYWEAHLKAGHVPPDHKMESFIRSKYESRRWAMSAPIPHDPSVFDGQEPGSASLPPANIARSQPAQPSPGIRAGAPVPAPTSTGGRSGHHALLSTGGSRQQAQPTAPPQKKPAAATAFDLLGDDFGESVSGPPAPSRAPASTTGPAPTTNPTPTTTAAPPRAAATASKPSAGLFDLDFKTPPPPPGPSSTVTKSKTDIMSLFKTASYSANSSARPTTTFAPMQSPGSGTTSAPAVQDMFAGLDLGGGGRVQAPVTLAPIVSPGLDFTAPRQPSYFASSNPTQSSPHRSQSSTNGATAFANLPEYAPNPQQAYASWNGGGTATAPPTTANGWGESAAPVKLPPGMGGDIWGAAETSRAPEVPRPTVTNSSPTTARRKPSVSNPYLASGADVWGSPASAVPPAAQSGYPTSAAGYASNGGGDVYGMGGFADSSGPRPSGQGRPTVAQDDPFGSDIWK